METRPTGEGHSSGKTLSIADVMGIFGFDAPTFKKLDGLGHMPKGAVVGGLRRISKGELDEAFPGWDKVPEGDERARMLRDIVLGRMDERLRGTQRIHQLREAAHEAGVSFYHLKSHARAGRFTLVSLPQLKGMSIGNEKWYATDFVPHEELGKIRMLKGILPQGSEPENGEFIWLGNARAMAKSAGIRLDDHDLKQMMRTGAIRAERGTNGVKISREDVKNYLAHENFLQETGHFTTWLLAQRLGTTPRAAARLAERGLVNSSEVRSGGKTVVVIKSKDALPYISHVTGDANAFGIGKDEASDEALVRAGLAYGGEGNDLLTPIRENVAGKFARRANHDAAYAALAALKFPDPLKQERYLKAMAAFPPALVRNLSVMLVKSSNVHAIRNLLEHIEEIAREPDQPAKLKKASELANAFWKGKSLDREQENGTADD